MIPRNAYNSLMRLASEFPIIAITGPRQSGKTTLVRFAFPNKKFISFDDKSMRELASSNPGDFLKAFPDGVIIDEAQKVPDIFDAIKLIVDQEEYTPGKYILTGSSQLRLRENITDSLAGRVGLLKLLPFTIEELKNANELSADAYDLFLKGFYPPLHDKTKHFIPYDWFENYIDTYLDLDVREQINSANLSAFRKFIQICALYSGQLVNYEAMAKLVGVSSVTIKNWCSILETSYIIFFVEPDSHNLGKAIVKTPKLYFVDSGLLCHLLRINTKEELLLNSHKGNIVETVAVSELTKSKFNEARKSNITFFRDKNGFEVDIIADWSHTFAIDVKSNNEPLNKLSNHVKRYTKLRGDETKAKVFYLGGLTCTINDIQYISWKDWSEKNLV